MLKKIKNVNIEKNRKYFLKKSKSHIDFFYFFKSNAK